ncbi:MAG TPA: MFS transporter [Desulfomonilaceae bacterium]|nr:MFS transporter [Desulfomonilaceae bacterium]
MNVAEVNADTGLPANLQFWVFFLVAAAFATIYITQPVLPILQVEFGVNETRASLTISAVIFGIALSNLPLGMAADRFPIKPLVCIGGCVITLCGLVCAGTDRMSILIATRFVQGLFIPCLTTCVAAYLAKTLPIVRLNVVMGSYVAATVAGGLGGRLLGGFIHPPLHWRYAFVTASAILLTATIAACYFLPAEKRGTTADAGSKGFLDLIMQTDLLRIFSVAFSAFFVFSSVFNFLPFYLAAPPFGVSTQVITLTYGSYLIGIAMGPLSGKLSNRLGNGTIMALGALVFAGALALTLIKSVPGVAVTLALICAGFFSVHSAAAGSLNRRLTSSRGRANSLYVLFYYLGGFCGISLSGYMYVWLGWPGIVAMGSLMLVIPFSSGVWELLTERNSSGE